MITPAQIKEVLDAVDIEGLFELGAPVNEYETEARMILAALRESDTSRLTENSLTAIVQRVWVQMFGPFSHEGLVKRQAAFQRVARIILASRRELHQALRPLKRLLTEQEREWINEIVAVNAQWTDVDLGELETEAECTCGCRSVLLKLRADPQNPKALGQIRPIGAVEITTNQNEVIFAVLHPLNGSLSILEVVGRDGQVPNQWQEKSHTVSCR